MKGGRAGKRPTDTLRYCAKLSEAGNQSPGLRLVPAVAMEGADRRWDCADGWFRVALTCFQLLFWQRRASLGTGPASPPRMS